MAEYPDGLRPVRSVSPLLSHRTTRFTFELLDRFESPLLDAPMDGVGGGSLEWNYANTIKGGGRLAVTDVGYSDVNWRNARIKISQTINDIDYGLGVWVPTAPVSNWDHSKRSWDIELHDKLVVVQRDYLPSMYSVAAGTNLVNTVIDLLTEIGETNISATLSDAVAANMMVFEPGTSRLAIINALLRAAAYDTLRTGFNGEFRIAPYVHPSKRPVVHTFQDGANCIYAPTLNHDYDIFSVPNRVVAKTQGDSTTPMLVGVAENNDPNSKFSIPNIGVNALPPYEAVEAADQAAIDRYAQQKLVDWSSPSSSRVIRHAWLPLAIYDAVQFKHSPSNTDVRCVIDKTSVAFDPTALAASTIREVFAL